jgi:hypothetical protein
VLLFSRDAQLLKNARVIFPPQNFCNGTLHSITLAILQEAIDVIVILNALRAGRIKF